jgi:ABC-type transport system involved in multi-copper enzyme maturation permease subunit
MVNQYPKKQLTLKGRLNIISSKYIAILVMIVSVVLILVLNLDLTVGFA